MRNSRPIHLVLLSLCSFAAACGGNVDGGPGSGGDPLRRFPPPIFDDFAKDHSFLPFESWGSRFTASDSWQRADTPILFGHVDRDAKDDFIGFGDAGVYVGLSGGDKFASVAFVLGQFGTQQSWHANRHVRLVGDINHDGLDDIVGFGDAGVYTALSTGSGFGSFRFALADLGYNQGWRVDKHARLLADVDGDHNADIVAFGDAGVYVAFADGAGGFGPMQLLVQNFGTNQSWSAARHLRTTVDLNGDGRADLVGFGDAGVWTALSTGNGFTAPRLALADFGYNQSWRVERHARYFANVDADGRKDIVGFGPASSPI